MVVVTTKLSYADVYNEDGSSCTFALIALYAMLENRPLESSISHKTMPDWDSHEQFVGDKPYKKWFIIYEQWAFDDGRVGNPRLPVGCVYLSKANEIGIQISNLHQRKGYAEQAIQWLIEKTREPMYLANIAPNNEPSKELFTKLGFTPLQHTYMLQPQFFDAEDVKAARFDEQAFS